jgi:hypothetical protein
VRLLEALPQVDMRHRLGGEGQMLRKQIRDSPAVSIRRGTLLPGGIARRARVMRFALAGSAAVS